MTADEAVEHEVDETPMVSGSATNDAESGEEAEDEEEEAREDEEGEDEICVNDRIINFDVRGQMIYSTAPRLCQTRS